MTMPFVLMKRRCQNGFILLVKCNQEKKKKKRDLDGHIHETKVESINYHLTSFTGDLSSSL